MRDHDLPEATPATPATAESPLDRAAGAGGLHWPSDPTADPEGTDDGVPRSTSGLAGFDARG